MRESSRVHPERRCRRTHRHLIGLRGSEDRGLAPTLTRIPIRLAAPWRSKTVTTDPPRLTPHLEWGLTLSISADIPVRVAAFLEAPGETQWALSDVDASTEMELRADFFPFSWTQSDEVQVTFGFRRFAITDLALKNDPRMVVDVVVPPIAMTAEAFAVARIPAHAITLTAIVIAEVDTQRRRHGRWRIDPRHADELPVRLVPLTSGYQTGVIRE